MVAFVVVVCTGSGSGNVSGSVCVAAVLVVVYRGSGI